MLKNRLIFTLLYGDRVFNLSRNFNLQRVGDLAWVKENYELNSITKSIDELVILDVSRTPRDSVAFLQQIEALAQTCFMPIAAGGGVRSIDDVYRLFRAGADKIVLNTLLFVDTGLVKEIKKTYGSQSIVGSLDYKRSGDGERRVRIYNGRKDAETTLDRAIQHVNELEIGEIYLTSIDHDGAGSGYDIEGLTDAVQRAQMPVIASGGAGNYRHLLEGIQVAGASAVSTANLFNFMANGLEEARTLMAAEGANLCMWLAGQPGSGHQMSVPG